MAGAGAGADQAAGDGSAGRDRRALIVRQTETIGKLRGGPQNLADGSERWVTVHPSYLLRVPDEIRRREERARFVEDLVLIRKRAERLAA